jgi:hypothetical protein
VCVCVCVCVVLGTWVAGVVHRSQFASSDIFQFDDKFEEHQKEYEAIRREILGEDEEEEEEDDEDEDEDEEDDEEEQAAAAAAQGAPVYMFAWASGVSLSNVMDDTL